MKAIAKKMRKSFNRSNFRPPLDTILISDSDDELQNYEKLNETVIVVQNSSAAEATETPLFYESRSPNNGRDVKPIYLHAVSNCVGLSVPSNTTDEVVDLPASQPNPFEYSLISETSLQLTGNESLETITVQDGGKEGDDFLMLDDTLVAAAAATGDEAEKTMVAVEKGPGDGIGLNSSLEEGEIIDVEQNHDDSVVFVSEEKLTPKLTKIKVSRKGAIGTIPNIFIDT